MRKVHPPVPGSDAAELLQKRALASHESLNLDSLLSGADDVTGQANPDVPEAPLAMDGDELEEYRRQHPLATIMPVIKKLLVQPSHDSGLLVAVGDDVGRLLWVDGDPVMQRRAESMMFVAGADWSEASVGTSAPGTALALGQSIQISGAEHFKRSVHPWSCTAVPFHDPDSGAVLGGQLRHAELGPGAHVRIGVGRARIIEELAQPLPPKRITATESPPARQFRS